MNTAVALSVKRALSAVGHYRRALSRTRFPGVAVLGYHGLRDDALPAGSVPFENLHVRASTFEAHCRVIRESCDPISLDDWRGARAGRATLPARPVLVTFDDGYRSVWTIAGPILKTHAIPAVVFACSEPMALRQPLWFDALAERQGEAAVEQRKADEYGAWRIVNAASKPSSPRSATVSPL